MEVLVFGTTTDRQAVVTRRNSTTLDMHFVKDTQSLATPGTTAIFEIEETTGSLVAKLEGESYYCIHPDTVDTKKVKPALFVAGAQAPAERRLRFMRFSEDDARENDYLISSVDNKFALVDHPKFDKCAIGTQELASAWYVSACEEQENVPTPSQPPTPQQLGAIASAVHKAAKNKSGWLDKTGDFVPLTEVERQCYLSPDFETKIDRSTFLFHPHGQTHIDTAAQLLLRLPAKDSDLKAYAKLIGCESTNHLGFSVDDSCSSAVLGHAGRNALALMTFGDSTAKRKQMVAFGLKHTKPSLVLLDTSSLGFTAEDIKELADACPSKHFTVVVSKRKDDQALADKIDGMEGNVELIRNSVSATCASRFRNNLEFCAVYHCAGPKMSTRGPFKTCDDALVGLLGPLMSTSMLHHNNWIEVAA
uniref:Uncharacterized protein n=1 Tax=viral metagenome TaxID=1070528 RepID=A0A6C0KE37_9ZZZZ